MNAMTDKPAAPRILLVIPTYNNKSSLRRVTLEAQRLNLPVLVVNDGSTDGTEQTIADLPVGRLDLPHNRGKGRAIKEAARRAAGQGFTHIITIDADGQHNPVDALRFIEKIKQQPLSIVIGERDFDGTNTPGSSVFGRKFSNFWIKASSGLSVTDSQSGFRAYPLEALNRIHTFSSRYNFEVEILVRGIWAGLEVQTVPIAVRYDEQTRRASHFRPFADNLRISLTYTYLVCRNFFPWPHKILYGSSANEKVKKFVLNPFKGLKMLATEKTSNREIVVATMVGIFIGTLPLLSLHSVIIIFVATRLKLNRLIALNVSHFCAPPFVPALAVEIGYFIRHGRWLTEFTMETLGHQVLQRLWEYVIGATLLAPFTAALAGGIAWIIVRFLRRVRGRKRKTRESSALV